MKRAILFAGAVFLVVFAASTASSMLATGTDNQAVDAITDITDNAYTPWFEPLWTPGGTGESILFAVQAALGALVIGHFLIPVADKSNSK